MAKAEIDKTKEIIEDYIKGNNPSVDFPRDGATYNWVSTDISAKFTYNHPQGEDAKYDLKKFDDIYYIDQYFTNDEEDIGSIFGKILNLINGESFIPIGGQNDNGVSDAITYMDPIGDYMDVKESSITTSKGTTDMAMLLFGEMHGVVRTGVYDFQFNNSHGIISKDQEGWYYNDSEERVTNEDDQNWDKATYRLCGDTTREYVPTLDEGSLTDQQRNTTYTIYRFAESTTERNTPKLNPSYEEDRNVTYKLSDIRIWTEYTGDYIGEQGSGSAVDLGYDEALYVNIPVSALPIQMARINLDDNGEVTQYSTNINEDRKIASTPFRLFYGVGVQDRILTEDKKNIDIAKLSPEYIQKNTDDEGFINFYSNYYSGSTHSHDGNSQTIGDPNFTFSPNKTNRYYAFQKPVVLYEDKDGVKKDIIEKDDKDVYQKFLEGLKGSEVTEATQLESDKYYYIELEYYVPTDDGKGEVTHILKSRKGSEFGSEIAGGNVAVPAEYLAWYNPKTGDVVPFAILDEDGKPTENYAEKPGPDYVIATKPEGLRVGNICKNIETKSANNTGTAEDAYIPIVSNNATSDNVILNGYLGNNGRIRVKDSTLQITKEVEGFLANDDYKEEQFEFDLTMQPKETYANSHVDAITILENNKYKNGVQKWLIQPNAIDVVTDNQGFIQASEVNPELPKTLATTDDGKYYIYLGSSEEDHTFHLYKYENDKQFNPDAEPLEGVGKRDAESNDGSIEYYAKVYLVPVDGFNEESFNSGELSGYQSVDDYVIATLDAKQKPEEQITSKYLTRTEFLTKPLDFDENGKTAFKLKLKHGEGILLTGLEANVRYTVEEKLTPEQKEKGYRFDHAYNNVGGNIASSGEGTVGGSMTDQITDRGVHYVNRYYMLNDLSISKEVRGHDVVTVQDKTDKEWNFTIKLKFNDGEDHGQSVTYDYHWYDLEGTHIPEKDGKITLNKNVDGTYLGEFTLKHNEKMKIQEILSGTEYEITEKEAQDDPNGYITTIKNAKGVVGGTQSDVRENIDVECINFNPSEQNITIEKEVKGQTANKEADWEFEVALKAPEDFRLADEYDYEKTDGTTGKIKLDKADNDGVRKAKVKLKHGEKITIKGLPEGTEYTVTEIGAKTDGTKNDDGYTTEILDEATGTLPHDDDVEMKFVNSKIEYYNLALKKIVNGQDPGNVGDSFKFKVTFKPGADYELEPISYKYANGSKEGRLVLPGTRDKQNNDIELTDNQDGTFSAEFTLQDQDVVNFSNIIEGTEYDIKEELTQAQSGYETTTQGDPEEGLIDVNNPSPDVTFINTRYTLHDLTVKKVVTGGASETNRNFRFRVTFTPAADVNFKTTYPYKVNGQDAGTITLNNNGDGTYSTEFNLKHNETFTIEDIPERTQYSVTELDANTDGYDTKLTEGEDHGVLDKDSTEVEFTNTRLARYGLRIQKNVEGQNPDRNREFTFRVTLIPSDEVQKLDLSYPYTGSKNGTLQLTDNQDGTYTGIITLKDSQYVIINNLPEGTQYIIEEVEANEDGYVTRNTDNKEGTLDGHGQPFIIFTNTKTPPHSLTISKEVEGGAGNLQKSWNFEVRLTPPAGVKLEKLTYTGGIIVEGAPVPYSGEMTLVEDEQEPGTYVGNITLVHGQSITIQDIPDGTRYSVKEKEANQDEYITYTQGKESGTITGNVGIVVAYKNKKAQDMDLTISKIVEGSAGDKNADWHIDIKLTPDEHVNFKTSYRYTGTKTGIITFVKQEDGSYLGTLTLKHGDKVTIVGIPKGTRHEIVEREANGNGYTTEVEGQTTGVLNEEGREIDFTNTKIGYYDLAVKKKVEGRLADKTRKWNFEIVLTIPNYQEPTAEYEYTKINRDASGQYSESTGTLTFNRNELGNYVARVELTHGEVITLHNIIEETQYSITEVNANTDGYITKYTDNSQGTIVDNNVFVEYTNRYISKLDLGIKKIVKGSDGETNRDWNFKITLTPPSGSTLDNSYPYTGSKQGNLKLTKNSDGTFSGKITLKHNESIVIEGLPEGTKYVIEEVESNQEGYTTTVDGKEKGTLSYDSEDVTFTNSRLSKHDLTLEKIVKGGAGDKNKEWTFDVILTPAEGVTLESSYEYTGSKEGRLELKQKADGTFSGKIKLKHGEKVTIKGLPEGTTYRVQEREANQDGYETTYSENAEGELKDSNTPVVTYINTKIAKQDLTLKKIVQGVTADKDREWTFEITLIPGEDMEMKTTYEFTGSRSGTIEFTKNTFGTYTAIVKLKHGESITIKDLVEGTSYKIVEREANQDGYTTNTTNNTEGTITNKDITVEFFNSTLPDIPDNPGNPNNPEIPKTPRKPGQPTMTYKTVNNKYIVRNNNITKNPRTFDNIKENIGLFVASIIMVSGSAISIFKKK